MCQSDQVGGNSQSATGSTQSELVISSVKVESNMNSIVNEGLQSATASKRSIFSKKLDVNKYSPYKIPEHSYISSSDETVKTSNVNITDLLNSCGKNSSSFMHRSSSMPGRLGSSLSSPESIDVHSPIDLSNHLPWLSHGKKRNKFDYKGDSQPQLPELTSLSSDSSEQSVMSEQKRSIFGSGGLNLKMRTSNANFNASPSSPKPKSILRRSSFSSNSFSTNSLDSIPEKSQHERMRWSETQQIEKLAKKLAEVTSCEDEEPNLNDFGSSIMSGPPRARRFRSQSMSCLNKVSFSARVNVLEFRRTIEEQKHMNLNGWFSVEELEQFKNNAIDEIQQYRARKAFSSGDISPYDSPHSVELLAEIQDVLVVDCHDIFLKLFSKALVEMMPHLNVVTAQSASEALKLIKSAKEEQTTNIRMHGFDIIIVEERLKPNDNTPGHQFRRRREIEKCHSVSPAGVNELLEDETLSLDFSSGSDLISFLTKQELSGERSGYVSLNVGVSAFLDRDREKLQKAGANMIWGKPPPKMDLSLSRILLTELIKKRKK